MKAKIDGPADPTLLQDNRLFAGIPSELLSGIGADMDVMRYDAGDVIFQEGDAGDCLYLICDGTVRISKARGADQQETLDYIQRGNFFGEMAMIDGGPRSAQATAATPTILARLDQRAFARIVQLAPENFHGNFLRCMVERLRSVNSHFIMELMRNERLSTVGTMANSVIHDLRGPIQIIRSCAEMVASRTKDEQIVELTLLQKRTVNQMMDMIQELIDFARGENRVRLERVKAAVVFEELFGQLVRMIPENIELIKDASCEAEVELDAGRFARLLMNLVRNAIEAMPGGGVLRVGVRVEDGSVVYTVSDTGCGIPEELQPRVFEPFVTHGKTKGTGLGLAIASTVAHAHHGRITLTSKEGEGTTFEVRIPVL